MKANGRIHISVMRYLLLSMLLGIGVGGGIWGQAEYADFQREADGLREEFLNRQQDLLRDQVGMAASLIHSIREQTTRRVQEEARQRTESACQIAWSIYEQHRDRATPEEIQAMIRETLRPVRFNNGRGYFFIVDLDGVLVLSGGHPELEGRNLLEMQGGNGEFVVRDMLHLAQTHQESFYQYTWPKPGESTISYPKVSFVKMFAPYGWVIGAGEYLDDTTLQQQEEALQALVLLRFGEEGYFFGSTFAGDSLFSNGKITQGSGGNILGLTDPNGVKIIQEQIRMARDSGSGFVRYAWKKLSEADPAPKLSYVVGIPEWQWVIGAGVYLDTIEREISGKKDLLLQGLRQKILKSMGLVLGLLVLQVFWARRLAGRIRRSIDALTDFFAKAPTGPVALDTRALNYRELREVAEAANRMFAEKQAMEEALQESEQRYSNMFLKSKSSMLLVDPDSGEIVDANPAACVYYGYEHAVLIQKKINEINMLPVDEIRRLMGEIKAEKQHCLHFPHRLANGEIRDVEVNSSPVVIGGRTLLFSIIHDVSERLRAEGALRESRENLALVQRVALIGSWTQELTTGKISWSDELYRIYGLDSAVVTPSCQTALELVHPEDRQEYRRVIGNVLQAGQAYSLKYRIIRPDKTMVHIHEQGDVILEATGKTAKLVAALQDVTEMKRLEDELLHSRKMESMGTLAGGIAHDFNNILSSIIGYAELIQLQLPPGSPVLLDVGQIIAAGKRAAELVRQILAFSRKEECRLEVIEPQPLVREVLRMLRASLPATVELISEIDGQCGSVRANPTTIHQVVMNLCTNAVHAMEQEKGILRVALYRHTPTAKELAGRSDAQAGPHVVLEVSDTGHGMDESTKSRIFEPYFTTKDVDKGTGLGLAVVHGIVRECGGFVRVESTPGSGTSFFVYFPELANKGAVDRRDIVASAEVCGGDEHILLVDDEISLVQLNTAALEHMGYTVSGFTSSEDALAAFRQNPGQYDLLITDQTMPGITGAELAAAMMSLRPGFPVILCTGYSAVISEFESQRRGVRRFAGKPVSIRDLTRMVREVLDAEKS